MRRRVASESGIATRTELSYAYQCVTKLAADPDRRGVGEEGDLGGMHNSPSCMSMASKLCRYSWVRASSAEQRRAGSKANSRPSRCTAASPALPKCLPQQYKWDQWYGKVENPD